MVASVAWPLATVAASVHSDCLGCGIEPRKIRYRRGRGFLFARRQHVRHRYARCCRSAGSKATSRAKGSYRNLGDLISDPLAMCLNGPCREGEEPTPAMYGGEKSDRAIVAMKPANKAERSGAESVERRARAVGSAVQRYTRVGHSADVGAPIAGLLRVGDPPLPKVGAVCGKAARTVLCGGRSAMSVPAAIGVTCMSVLGTFRTSSDACYSGRDGVNSGRGPDGSKSARMTHSGHEALQNSGIIFQGSRPVS